MLLKEIKGRKEAKKLNANKAKKPTPNDNILIAN